MSNGNDPFAPVPPETVTISDVTQQEVDPRQKAKLDALGQKDAGTFNALWAARAAHITDAPSMVVSLLTGIVDAVMTQVVKLLTAAQGEQNSTFYDLAAAVLHDLTGVEVDAAALKSSAYNSGRIDAMKTFGGDLYDLLQKEFQPASGNLEEGDDGPAKAFLGFLMNFAVRQGNIETILSMIPEEYRMIDGAREYGELMAKNLGLGRLARRALQPLIQIMVTDPLMYKLQNDFRPKRIGASPAIKKFFRDATFEDQMRKELGQEGYNDDRINDLITDLRPLLSPRDILDALFRSGTAVDEGFGLGDSFSETQLKKHGYTPDDISVLLRAQRPALKESEIALLFLNGFITHELASGYMAKLGYDSDTAELALQAHSFQHQHQHRLGLGELKKAFKNNVIDLLELKAHLSSQGYSDDDIQIITLDLLQPTTGKVRQLSLAEIKAGYKAGVLTQQQAAEHLKQLGYSDADVQIIVASMPGPKTTTTPATPPSTPPTTP